MPGFIFSPGSADQQGSLPYLKILIFVEQQRRDTKVPRGLFALATRPIPKGMHMAHVLVVDDSSTVRNEVCEFLKSNGMDVAAAVDGKDGLAKLKADPAIKLVVSDVNMPNMDGLTMAEKIRNELKNPAVNIIMLTTENTPSMKERGKAANVKGWIIKPFNGPAVIATFKKLAGL
jgi:two-component system chemotaxis response regulator CheY